LANDLASLRTVDLGRAERPEVIDRPVDARDEFGEAARRPTHRGQPASCQHACGAPISVPPHLT
jgi:hypothetical protein